MRCAEIGNARHETQSVAVGLCHYEKAIRFQRKQGKGTATGSNGQKLAKGEFVMDDMFDDNLEYWENRFYSDYGWIPRLDTQRGIDELQEFKDECRQADRENS